jgi:hypothetical protein
MHWAQQLPVGCLDAYAAPLDNDLPRHHAGYREGARYHRLILRPTSLHASEASLLGSSTYLNHFEIALGIFKRFIPSKHTVLFPTVSLVPQATVG